MAVPGRIFAAILAAGASSRFDAGPKVDAIAGGMPLGEHAVRLLARFPWHGRAAVVRQDSGPFAERARAAGLALIVNRDAAQGLAHSLKRAAEAAAASGADGLLVLLADMPFVSPAHVERLVAAFAGRSGEGVAATRYPDGHAGPPALFGASLFPRLLAMDGDRGAGALLRDGRLVTMVSPDSPVELADIDSTADLGLFHDSGPSGCYTD